LSEPEFIARITDSDRIGQAVIRHKNGSPVPVSYMVIASRGQELPYYIGLVWPQHA
jgi:hypothetical protein